MRGVVTPGVKPTKSAAWLLVALLGALCASCSGGAANGDGGGGGAGGGGGGGGGDGDGGMPPPPPDDRLPLRDGWAIRSSAAVTQGGDLVSTVGFDVGGWTPARVPTTVVAAQVAHGDFPDPNYGMNMRNIPGTTDYPIGENFSLYDMSDANPYKVPWWFRTEFDLPAKNQRTWLHFDGVNYRADIWLNGKLVANRQEIAGAYRRFALDVTAYARPGQRNALAVEVYAPGKSDLAPSFIDWNPTAADRNLGLWQDVYVRSTGPVRVQAPFVVSQLPSLDQARLTVNADLINDSDAPVAATVAGTIDGLHFTTQVMLAAHETRPLSLDPDHHPELVIGSPKLWWPYQLGPQNLHDLTLEVDVAGQESDRVSRRFGIREVGLQMVDGIWASYSINGKPLMIRGGGYATDMLLRFSETRDEQEMQLVKEMGLNAIRIEGKLASDHLFDVTDREGILVLAGWECCSAWEYWIGGTAGHGVAPWSDATREVARASLQSQLLRLRGRASMLTWLYGSDSHPPADIEQMYLGVIADTRWPLPTQNQASERDPSTITGPSGFKMTGPYDYVPPSYWYVDSQHGGAFGFNSETGPGAAVPNVESLKKLLPAGNLWPIDDVWNYHMGGGRFGNLDIHTQALEGRYGQAMSLDDYALKAQALAYDGERAMFEAYRRNKGKTTGVIAWMLNNGWPSLLWHLYDYYLAAGGGYYGTKKANEPVHIQYSYDDRTVVVVNDSAATVSGLRATAEVYDIHLNKLFSQDASGLTVPTDKSTVALTIAALGNLSPTYFVRLLLRDTQNQLVSQNFYWLSTSADVLDWNNTAWWGTPVLAHANLTGLNSLAMVTAALSATAETSGANQLIHVKVQNKGNALAFLLRLRIDKGSGGAEVLPSLWSDNYISLLPGETRELTARFAIDALGGARPVVVASGWNVPDTAAQP